MREFPSFGPGSRPERLLLSLLALFLLAFALPPAEAKLGASPRQCARIYGPPSGDTAVPGLIPDGLIFQRGEYSITCGFERGVCTVVVVLRHSPGNPELEAIPREDISLFIHDNFENRGWTFTRLSSRELLWKTHDWDTQTTYSASFARSLQMLTMKMER